jgi:hypothetical protein
MKYRTPPKTRPEGESGRLPSDERVSKMGEFKKYAMTAVVILVVISIYNSLLKTYLPTGIRSIVGLG